MATGLSYASRSSSMFHQGEDPLLWRFSNVSPLPSISYQSHLRRPFVLLRQSPRSRFARCLAAAPGPPSPPESDLNSDGNSMRLTGLAGALSRVRDRTRIFFAVLFWMSLFFWASASDRRGKSKRKKGSRFK